jgi:hypothetical protein
LKGVGLDVELETWALRFCRSNPVVAALRRQNLVPQDSSQRTGCGSRGAVVAPASAVWRRDQNVPERLSNFSVAVFVYFSRHTGYLPVSRNFLDRPAEHIRMARNVSILRAGTGKNSPQRLTSPSSNLCPTNEKPLFSDEVDGFGSKWGSACRLMQELGTPVGTSIHRVSHIGTLRRRMPLESL